MTPEFNNGEGRPDGAERDVAQPIGVARVEEPLDVVEPEETKSVLDSLRDAYLRARDGRARNPAKEARAAKTVDRSKGLLVLVVAVVVMLFVFLGLFSTSSATKHREANRTKPNLGRPEMPAASAAQNRGSVTPLLTADTSGQDGNSDQISADDVSATGRLRMRAQAKAGGSLASVPPMDPALDAYRQAKAGYPVPQPAMATAIPPSPAPPATAALNGTDSLKKPSLVFVSANSNPSASAVRPASIPTQPALMEPSVNALLPNGTRLVARLQSAVSTDPHPGGGEGVWESAAGEQEWRYWNPLPNAPDAGWRNREDRWSGDEPQLRPPPRFCFGRQRFETRSGTLLERCRNHGSVPCGRARRFWRRQRSAQQQHSVARTHRVERGFGRGTGNRQPGLERKYGGFSSREHQVLHRPAGGQWRENAGADRSAPRPQQHHTVGSGW
jgi:hypothetical protein